MRIYLNTLNVCIEQYHWVPSWNLDRICDHDYSLIQVQLRKFRVIWSFFEFGRVNWSYLGYLELFGVRVRTRVSVSISVRVNIGIRAMVRDHSPRQLLHCRRN